MSTLSDQVALLESANETLRTENESLRQSEAALRAENTMLRETGSRQRFERDQARERLTEMRTLLNQTGASLLTGVKKVNGYKDEALEGEAAEKRIGIEQQTLDKQESL
jgi:hypothetical protein